jgi:hypothetical protein
MDIDKQHAARKTGNGIGNPLFGSFFLLFLFVPVQQGIDIAFYNLCHARTISGGFCYFFLHFYTCLHLPRYT